MARLFEIIEEIDNCFIIPESDEVVDVTTGEILDIEHLNNLNIEKDKLLTYLLQKVVNEDSDAKAFKTQKEIFEKKQKAAENRRDSLKQYISAALNGHSFEAEDKSVKATFRKSESVNIIDLNLIRDEYKSEKIEIHADKKAIKEAIKNGFTVPGAELVENMNIQIK